MAPEVLVVGRLIGHKRVDVALESFAQLRNRTPAARMGMSAWTRSRISSTVGRRWGPLRDFFDRGDDTSTWHDGALSRATSER